MQYYQGRVMFGLMQKKKKLPDGTEDKEDLIDVSHRIPGFLENWGR